MARVVVQAVLKKTDAKALTQEQEVSTSAGEKTSRQPSGAAEIKISIIIPVFNEFPRLEAQLQSLERFRCPDIEIIIVDGGSDDGTATRCKELEGCLVDKVLESQTGRSWQMNTGAAVAQGEWLFFLHVDSQLPNDWLSGFLSQDVSLRAQWGFFKLALSNSSLLYRGIASSINFRSRVSGGATGDQCLFVRRTVFEDIGGYAEIPLMEDVELCDRLKKIGRAAVMPQTIVTSSRRWESSGVLNTIIFMWRLRISYRMGACPWVLARDYYPNVKFSNPVRPRQ